MRFHVVSRKYLLLGAIIFGLNAISLFSTIANASSSEPYAFHGALGVSNAWNSRKFTNDYSFSQFSPELVAHGYSYLTGSFWLRTSLRLSYAWSQPDMAQSLQVRETDWKGLAEFGVVWSGVVVPSISVGVGTILRSTSLAVAAPIQNNSQIGGTSWLPVLQAQVGLGIPIEEGWIVIEPYVRTLHIFGDSRYHWAYGAEGTVSVF